jgi:hypothetical protein
MGMNNGVLSRSDLEVISTHDVVRHDHKPDILPSLLAPQACYYRTPPKQGRRIRSATGGVYCRVIILTISEKCAS